MYKKIIQTLYCLSLFQFACAHYESCDVSSGLSPVRYLQRLQALKKEGLMPKLSMKSIVNNTNYLIMMYDMLHKNFYYIEPATSLEVEGIIDVCRGRYLRYERLRGYMDHADLCIKICDRNDISYIFYTIFSRIALDDEDDLACKNIASYSLNFCVQAQNAQEGQFIPFDIPFWQVDTIYVTLEFAQNQADQILTHFSFNFDNEIDEVNEEIIDEEEVADVENSDDFEDEIVS